MNDTTEMTTFSDSQPKLFEEQFASSLAKITDSIKILECVKQRYDELIENQAGVIPPLHDVTSALSDLAKAFETLKKQHFSKLKELENLFCDTTEKSCRKLNRQTEDFVGKLNAIYDALHSLENERSKLLADARIISEALADNGEKLLQPFKTLVENLDTTVESLIQGNLQRINQLEAEIKTVASNETDKVFIATENAAKQILSEVEEKRTLLETEIKAVASNKTDQVLIAMENATKLILSNIGTKITLLEENLTKREKKMRNFIVKCWFSFIVITVIIVIALMKKPLM